MSRLTPVFLAIATLTGAGSALAHDGHGLFGSHWHATDALGFIAAVAGVAALIWTRRK